MGEPAAVCTEQSQRGLPTGLSSACAYMKLSVQLLQRLKYKLYNLRYTLAVSVPGGSIHYSQ